MEGIPMPQSRRTSKTKAIQNALGQLGWHANANDVVALLASYGVEVNEGLVSKVKVESLKDSTGVKRQMTKAQQARQPPVIPRIRRVPQRRSYWR